MTATAALTRLSWWCREDRRISVTRTVPGTVQLWHTPPGCIRYYLISGKKKRASCFAECKTETSDSAVIKWHYNSTKTRNSKWATAEGWYCNLLKRTYLTFAAWLQTLNCGEDDRKGGGGHIAPIKTISLGQYVTFFPLVAICKVFTALTTQNATENNCLISRAQNTTGTSA